MVTNGFRPVKHATMWVQRAPVKPADDRIHPFGSASQRTNTCIYNDEEQQVYSIKNTDVTL